jgi:acylphosphatase
MDTESFRLHAVISGSVQGVGFRQFVLRHAQRLALHGWVRNRWDRKVELTAEGTQQDLQILLERISEGPPASSVRNVDVEWKPPTGEFDSFEVTG